MASNSEQEETDFRRDQYTFGQDPERDAANGFPVAPTGAPESPVAEDAPTGAPESPVAEDAPTGAPESPVAEDAPTGVERVPEVPEGSYDGVIRYLQRRQDALHIPTREELERERRRQRTKSVIAGLSDAAAAVAGLIGAINYAPQSAEPQVSLSERMRQRQERLRAERERDEQRYYQYAMQIANLKNSGAQQEYQRGRDALADRLAMAREQRAIARELREEQLAAARALLREGRLTEQEYRAEIARIRSEHEAEYQEARVAALRRRQGRGPEFVWRDVDGTDHYCYTEAAARNQAAHNGGRYITTPTRSTHEGTGPYGAVNTTITRDVSTGQLTIPGF